MNDRRLGLREIERWVGWVRLGAIVFALFQVEIGTGYPRGYLRWAWTTTAFFIVGTLLIFWASRRVLTERGLIRLSAAALAFDTAIVSGYVVVYNFEQSGPIRQLLYLPIVEGALRYGIAGSVAVALASVPVLGVFEWLRARRLAPLTYHVDYVSFQVGVELILGLIVGWLVYRMRRSRELAESRAVEAEGLRDELGRRVDVLEAANRCARALASSLELDQAFRAFIRELRGLVPFDRMAIVLVTGDRAEVMANAGLGAEEVFPPGTIRKVGGSVIEDVLAGQTVYRRDLSEPSYPEEEPLFALGIRSRLATPLSIGARTVGMLSVQRTETDAFTQEEIELISLLGRLVATAVQNIRAYEGERSTAEELRRLSALRADFVSLVSHELRSPMASVIGAAKTLQQRWRTLSPEQRESFLALIADETSRLAALITDVLDTSRIEAGTFSYAFTDVDIATLVDESVAAAQVGQDEIRVRAEIESRVPPVRGDVMRLRQILVNLIDNAIKYSPAGEEVAVSVHTENGSLLVEVTDHGPGVNRDEQKLIFEKFGRGPKARPGTGLGLFIARSIAEAHGGALEVRSVPERGSTFTLSLPLLP